MNGRTLILLVVAVVFAIVTAVVVKNRAQPVAVGGAKVLVASSEIAAGTFVHADKQLAWADWVQSSITPSFITPEVHKIEEFNGGVARRTILVGEPITAASIVRANEGGFMSAVLTPGMRAVSIAVTLTSGNAGFIFPGDKVDLILTHRIPLKDGGSDVLASETFIEDVRVLAIDQMLNNPDNKAVVAKTITLEVTPKQVEMINVATNLGTISVSLRSLANNASKQTKKSDAGLASSDFIGNPDETYSTNNDVSRLMGDKSEVRSKVSVYHGNTTEQIDFHQGQK